MVESASPLKRSAFIVDLRQDFSLLMQLNVFSHSTDVSGKVHKILSNLFTLGKRLLSQALSARSGGVRSVFFGYIFPLNLPLMNFFFNQISVIF